MNFTDEEIERQRIANERHDLEREREELEAEADEQRCTAEAIQTALDSERLRAEKAEARVAELEAALLHAYRSPWVGPVEVVDSVGGATLEVHPGAREGTRGSEPAEAPQAATEAHAARATGAAPGPGTGGTFPCARWPVVDWDRYRCTHGRSRRQGCNACSEADRLANRAGIMPPERTPETGSAAEPLPAVRCTVCGSDRINDSDGKPTACMFLGCQSPLKDWRAEMAAAKRSTER